MPSRKQRRRTQKGRRHEYETVWVDEEGNELEEPPEDLVATAPQQRNGAKRDGAKPKAKAPAKRGGRQMRVPPAPSWRRAIRRALILGAVIFVAFYVLGSRNSSGSSRLTSALLITVIYTALFIPFTFYVDRFSYGRWQRRVEQQGAKGSAKKR